MRYDFLVVGAGPAGAYFARLAADKGYKVLVVDQSPHPGFKVCGGAIPAVFEQELFKIPSEVVLVKIHGFRVYLDDELVWEDSGRLWGYLVDKKKFLEYLLEGIDVKFNMVFDTKRSVVKGLDVKWDTLVYATGPHHVFSNRELIYAVQCIASGSFEKGSIEIYFDSNHVGYYWVFPLSEKEARVGVGGYAEPTKLIEMLSSFLKNHGFKPITAFKGSPINIGGADERLFKGPWVVVGEAAGFVYPVTGEGIRPAMLSAKAAFEMVEGKDARWIKKVVEAIRVQKIVLEKVKKLKPESRRRYMRLINPRFALEFALGRINVLTRLFMKLPASLLKLVS